jgi:hypothetical protein
LSDDSQLEKQLLAYLVKESFNGKAVPTTRILQNFPGMKEEQLCDIFLRLYAHNKIIGRIIKKSFEFGQFNENQSISPEEFLGKPLTPQQQEILQNPPPNPFIAVENPQNQQINKLEWDYQEKSQHADEGVCLCVLIPEFDANGFMVRAQLNNPSPRKVLNLSLKMDLPKGLTFIRLNPFELIHEYNPVQNTLEIQIAEITANSTYDFYIHLKITPLKQTAISGILKYLNAIGSPRVLKVPTLNLSFLPPKIIPFRIPSFQKQEYLSKAGQITGVKLFARPLLLEPKVAFNYMKNAISELDLVQTQIDTVEEENNIGFFFGKVDSPEYQGVPEFQRIVAIIARVREQEMGFQIQAPDPEIVGTLGASLTQRFAKRFELGGILGGELIELECHRCGTVIPEYFGTGIKHFCQNCGQELIWY